jgi:alkylation response protein AidB-like acyl-CoA dehydrogenase
VVGPGSSVDKLLVGRAEKDINDLILDVRRDWMLTGVGAAPAATSRVGAAPAATSRVGAAPAATSRGGAGSAKELNAARAKWWYTRAATIMGGSAEVQRGIIADHLLGLPREKR